MNNLKGVLTGYKPNFEIKNYNNMVTETPILDKSYYDTVENQIEKASKVTQRLLAARLANEK